MYRINLTELTKYTHADDTVHQSYCEYEHVGSIQNGKLPVWACIQYLSSLFWIFHEDAFQLVEYKRNDSTECQQLCNYTESATIDWIKKLLPKAWKIT